MTNPIFGKSIEFTSQIALFYESYSKSGLDATIAQELLLAATKMGTSINKSIYGNNKDEFVSFLKEALKDAVECVYLLNTLAQANLFSYDYAFLLSLAEDIKNTLIASVNATGNSKTSKWDKYNSGNYGGNYSGGYTA